MKHFMFICFFIFVISVSLFSQETKIVTNYFSDHKQIRETISVIANTPAIKQGKYVLYYHKPQTGSYKSYSESWIRTEGYYKNNIKDSIWKAYNDPTRYVDRLDKEEHYKDGKKIGIWLTWVDEGTYERYDYDKNKPLFPLFLKPWVKYPEEALVKGIEGMVDLRIIYNEDYTISSIKSLNNVDSVLLRYGLQLARHKSSLLRKYAINFKDTFIMGDSIKMNFKLR